MGYLVFLLLSHCLALTTLSYNEEKALAQKFAPVLWQELGSDVPADWFTRVDFDGDWVAENNWENLDRVLAPPAAVYYSVIETKSRWYITYALFFPRDYADVCFWIHCHENDFEGMRVTVEKPERLVSLEGLAHNRLSVLKNPTDNAFRIEAGGHGIHPLTMDEIRPLAQAEPHGTHRRYGPTSYELRSLLEIWHQADTPLFRSTFNYRGRQVPAAFAGDDWIVWGLGAAKPPWSWEIWGSDWQKGEWFMDPSRGAESYLHHPFLAD